MGAVCDPACGSGSLLLKAVKILGKDAVTTGFLARKSTLRHVVRRHFLSGACVERNSMTKKYKLLDWWIEASGYYAGYKTTIFVCSKDGRLCVEPKEFEAQIKKLTEDGKCAPGLSEPPKESFSQLFHIVECRFFDDGATNIAYEGEFEPVESVLGRIY